MTGLAPWSGSVPIAGVPASGDIYLAIANFMNEIDIWRVLVLISLPALVLLTFLDISIIFLILWEAKLDVHNGGREEVSSTTATTPSRYNDFIYLFRKKRRLMWKLITLYATLILLDFVAFMPFFFSISDGILISISGICLAWSTLHIYILFMFFDVCHDALVKSREINQNNTNNNKKKLADLYDKNYVPESDFIDSITRDISSPSPEGGIVSISWLSSKPAVSSYQGSMDDNQSWSVIKEGKGSSFSGIESGK